MPSILVGHWGGERILWHDVWTLEAGKVMQMTVSRTPSADSAGKTTLYLITAHGIFHTPVGTEGHPVRASWPKTNGETHIQAYSGVDFGFPVNVKGVRTLVLMGEFLQSDDNLAVYYRWDNDDRWYKSDNHSQFPIVLENLEGRGRILYVASQLSDGSRDAIAPYVSRVEIPDGKWDDYGPLHEYLGSDIVSPQAI